MVAVPQHALGVHVDAVRDEPPHAVGVSPGDQEVEGDGIAAVRADPSRVRSEDALREIIAAERDRGQQVERGAGVLAECECYHRGP